MTPLVTVISSTLEERIRSRAEEAYPEECCGFLTGVRDAGHAAGARMPWPERGSVDHEAAGSEEPDGEGEGVIVHVVDELPTRNVAAEEDRRREFLVDPESLLEVVKEYRDRDEDVVGFYHSHPDHPAMLSPTDLEFARLWPRTVWMIVPVREGRAGEARAWWLPETGSSGTHPKKEGPRREGPEQKGPEQKGPEQKGPEQEGPEQEGPEQDRGGAREGSPVPQEMIIRSSASADRAATPREERA